MTRVTFARGAQAIVYFCFLGNEGMGQRQQHLPVIPARGSEAGESQVGVSADKHKETPSQQS